MLRSLYQLVELGYRGLGGLFTRPHSQEKAGGGERLPRRKDEPQFFELHNYEWAFDKTMYNSTLELVYQVRALDAAIGLWKHTDRCYNNNLMNIVVRTTYLPSFSCSTPLFNKYEDINFIIIHLGWTEFLHWFFSGFSAYIGLISDGTLNNKKTLESIIKSDCKENLHNAKRHWISIIANIVASQSCCHEILIVSARTAICKEIDEFNDGIININDSVNEKLSRDFEYLALEMSICHEVGHLFAGDSLLPEDKNADEVHADRLGAFSFMSSAGWRNWCLNDYILSDVGRIVLGMHAFHMALASMESVNLCVAISNDWRKDQVDAILHRWNNIGNIITMFENQMRSYSPITHEVHEEQNAINAMLIKMGYYIRDFTIFANSFSEESIQKARRISEEQSLD